MREEADRVRQLQEEGYKQKLKNIEEGKLKREQKKVEFSYNVPLNKMSIWGICLCSTSLKFYIHFCIA